MPTQSRTPTKGYLLLADGTRLDGTLTGAARPAMGHVVANTAVVGFQEMATDPAYKGTILAFTYPEVGNVGVAKAFSESNNLQVAGLVVKVLSDYYSHYLAETSLQAMLAQQAVPCLTDVDTRGLAVHLRDHGEMPAAIAPLDTDPDELNASLRQLHRPPFSPTPSPTVPPAQTGPTVAVLDLGIRHSQLRQLALCCAPKLFPYDAPADAILADAPAGLFVSDGPAAGAPPHQTVNTIAALLQKLPILACGLGHVALGLALGCKTTFLKLGHHGANYPVRNLTTGTVEVTHQRHAVVLDRQTVQHNPTTQLLCENVNDASVEAIRTPDGSAVGFQSILAAPFPGEVNPHIRSFITALPAS